MKRINLSVDLEDNQLLEQSICNALRSYAQQVAREEFNKIIKVEIERVVHNKVSAMLKKWHGVSEIEKMAEEAIQDILRNDKQFSKQAIQFQIVEKCDELQKLLDQKIQDLDENFEGKVEAKIDAVADESVRKAFIRVLIP